MTKLLEGKLILLDNPDPELINKIKVFINPTKDQVKQMLNEDKFHIIRGFINNNNDLYCWRSYVMTHNEMISQLNKQEGLNINPICAIVFNNEKIQKANTWNNIISSDNKEKILNNENLIYLFGNNYSIIDL